MKRIIGISGYAKSGKTTIMERLKNELNAKEISFADHLKNTCSQVFSIPRNHFDDQSLKEKPFSKSFCLQDRHIAEIMELFEIKEWDFDSVYSKHEYKLLISPRHIAQYIGTDLLRSIDPEIHINTAFKKTPEGILVFPDVRFINEMQAIKKNNGIMIGVERKEVIPNLDQAHESEKSINEILSQCDHIIENNSTKQEFEEKALTLIKSLKLI